MLPPGIPGILHVSEDLDLESLVVESLANAKSGVDRPRSPLVSPGVSSGKKRKPTLLETP